MKVLWHAAVAVASIADSIALHVRIDMQTEGSVGCFTNVLRALQNNLPKIYNVRNNIYAENFKLKLCTCAQSIALATRTKFQLEIVIKRTILTIYKFRENILESSRNVSERPT